MGVRGQVLPLVGVRGQVLPPCRGQCLIWEVGSEAEAFSDLKTTFEVFLDLKTAVEAFSDFETVGEAFSDLKMVLYHFLTLNHVTWDNKLHPLCLYQINKVNTNLQFCLCVTLHCKQNLPR